MAILIKDAETDALIRELASRTGETIKDAVKKATKDRLAQLPPQPAGRIDDERLEAVLARLRSYPITDDRTAEELLGYDENGLPS